MDEEDLPLLNEEPARRRRRRRKTQTCCGCFAWDTCKWILWIAAGAAGAWIVYHLYLHYFGGTSDSHAEFTRVKAMRYATFASATYAPLNEVKAWDCKECVKSDVVPRNITVVETTPLFDGRVDVFTITPARRTLEARRRVPRRDHRERRGVDGDRARVRGGDVRAAVRERQGAFYTLVPIRPRSRGERRFLKDFARRVSPPIPRVQSPPSTPFNST